MCVCVCVCVCVCAGVWVCCVCVTCNPLGRVMPTSTDERLAYWYSVCLMHVGLNVIEREREREGQMFYLTTHSTHFIYGYMASDIWLRTILIVRKETRCRHIGYSYRLTARVLLYAPSHRQDNTYHGLCYPSCGTLAGECDRSQWVIRCHRFVLTIIRLPIKCAWTSLTHSHAHTRTHAHTHTHVYLSDTYMHTYIHTWDVSVAEWLAWLTSKCGRNGAIGSSQCVYVYVCIVNPDIQTIHRCSHTSIHIISIYRVIHWKNILKSSQLNQPPILGSKTETDLLRLNERPFGFVH